MILSDQTQAVDAAVDRMTRDELVDLMRQPRRLSAEDFRTILRAGLQHALARGPHPVEASADGWPAARDFARPQSVRDHEATR